MHNNYYLHSYKKYKHWKTINTTIQTLTKCRKRTKWKKEKKWENYSHYLSFTVTGAHKLFRRFLDFSQFLTVISPKLWRHLETNIRISSAVERAIPREKSTENLVEIGQQTATQCLFELCTPRTHSAPDSERERQKKNKQSDKHIFAPTAGARCMIFPKLCMMIERVKAIKMMLFVFRSNA